MDVDGDEAAAAGQLSQADIIERQAETIARLQRQVRKGGEYKQLTKSKLKEAAARLKEYRLRVEALQRELQEEQDKVKRQLKRATAKPKRSVKDAFSQTDERSTLTRASQTQLTGAVQRVNKKTLVDSGVQTVDISVDNGVSRKRGRGQVSASTQTETDQLVPRLSRDLKEVDTQALMEDVGQDAAAAWTSEEPLQLELPMLGASDAAFPHETSAALDAELAFSDSEDGEEDARKGDAAVETKESEAGGSGLIGGFDLTVLDEIDKELASSSDEDEGGEGDEKKKTGEAGKGSGEDRSTSGKDDQGAGVGASLLDGLDPAVANEIDKELETSSDEEHDGDENDEGLEGGGRRTGGAVTISKVSADTRGGRTAGVGSAGAAKASGSGFLGLDPAICSAIDDDLATSSDDEDGEEEPNDRGNPKEDKHTGLANRTGAIMPSGTRTLMSIDDELDDEFAALDSDSEPEHQEKKSADEKEDAGSSSSSSSDSDSSDSSDSDSEDEDADDPMSGTADKKAVSLARGEIAIKKSVTATAEMYSPIVEVEPQPKSPEPLELNGTAETISQSEEKPSVRPPSQQTPLHERSADAVNANKAVGEDVVNAAETTGAMDIEPSSSIADSSSISPSKQAAVVSPPSNLDELTDAAADSTQSSATSAVVSPNPAVSSMMELAESTEQDEETEGSSTDAGAASAVVSHDSASSVMVEPVKRSEQNDSHGSKTPAHAQPSAPTIGDIVGKTRKAEEANLDSNIQTIAKKKVKVGGGASVPVVDAAQERTAKPPTSATAETKKAEKKPAARSESKEEVRIKKSLAGFTKSIALTKGEEADKDYARRTIALLVNQSSKFVDTNLAHVRTLCQVLAHSYRELGVAPMTVLRGVLGIFRAPRSRRLMQDRKLGLSWLCNELLLKLVRIGDAASGSLCLSSVEECLEHLRGFLVEERANIGDSMTSSKIQLQIPARQVSVSHDKVFLAHICALHTHLCQSTRQLSRPRVLLFDLLRENPNIRGLYFAAIMVETYPAILERSFDLHCVERQGMLKETLLQALTAIACVAAERQELLLHQSSHTMLHRIADAIQMPELEEVNGADPSFSRSWVQTLYDKLSATVTAAGYYELAKSLEICTAVFGLDVVTQIFSIERCQELFSRGSLETKGGIISVVSHIALAVASKASDMQSPRSRTELFVEKVIDWLYNILKEESSGDDTSTDDRFKLLAKCAEVCVELTLEYSAAAGLDTRRRVLCAVVRWFDAASSDQLVGLPAAFLRRLRFAVVAARPQMTRVAG